MRENEKMLKRLQEKSGTKSRNKATSESEKNQSLAKMAGLSLPDKSMDGITKFSSKREQLLKKSSRKNRRIDGSGESLLPWTLAGVSLRKPVCYLEQKKKRTLVMH